MTMEQHTPQPEIVVPEAEDFLPLLGTDHVELIVGNAKQSAYYYMHAWGFQPLAFKGLEHVRQIAHAGEYRRAPRRAFAFAGV